MRTFATGAAIAAAAVAVAAAASGCGGTSNTIAVSGARPSNGADLIKAYGCGSCHTIAGVEGADGDVGPPLAHLSDRRYIAGKLPNTPPNLIRWIMAPQAVEPGTVMPDMGVDREDARDIAAYLYRH